MGSKRSLKDYKPTIPQTIMREDMERSTRSLAEVFDEVVGPQEAPASELSRFGQQQRRATQIALDIIDQHELVLSLKQWQVVQAMMEQAVMQGVQLELDS